MLRPVAEFKQSHEIVKFPGFPTVEANLGSSYPCVVQWLRIVEMMCTAAKKIAAKRVGVLCASRHDTRLLDPRFRAHGVLNSIRTDSARFNGLCQSAGCIDMVADLKRPLPC